jgi:hypothetical protein
MRGRCRVFSVIAILTLVLVVSAVFASGVVNPSAFTLNTMYGVQPDSPGTTVFVAPNKIIKDYVNDPGYQVGNKFTVAINITESTDLFTWQLNVTWNKAILNFTKITAYGDFLARTTSPDGTSRNVPIYGGSNASGYGWMAETILGNYPGITGGGRLVTIQFQVVGYGSTYIGFSTTGLLPTTLLNSAGSTMTFTTGSCYFRNVLKGDATFNKVVDSADISKVIYHRNGPPAGPGGYNRDVDIDDNGVIDSADISLVIANRGRTAP